jgi:hypothetical protein
MDILLVGPNGQAIKLMSDAGGDFALNNITVTFDPSASTQVPDAGPITNGSYVPFDYVAGDTFPFPAPSANITSLTNFNDASPNGIWSLYVVDDSREDAGAITGGWSLSLGLNLNRPVLSSPMMFESGQFQFILEGAQGVPHVIEASTNLTQWIPVSTNVANGPTLILIEPQNGIPYKFFRARVH